MKGKGYIEVASWSFVKSLPGKRLKPQHDHFLFYPQFYWFSYKIAHSDRSPEEQAILESMFGSTLEPFRIHGIIYDNPMDPMIRATDFVSEVGIFCSFGSLHARHDDAAIIASTVDGKIYHLLDKCPSFVEFELEIIAQLIERPPPTICTNIDFSRYARELDEVV